MYNLTEEGIVHLIDIKQELSEKRLCSIIDDYEIFRREDENERWTRRVFSVVELCNRYFMIEWIQGLTEMQMDMYSYQPYEVRKHEYEKTITVTEWIEIKEAEEGDNELC